MNTQLAAEPIFPESGYVGVAAEFAEAYSQRYESPKEFFYVDLLTLIGAAISGRVRADFDLPCQPRQYVLKVSKSAWRRKSTSTNFADDFFRSVLELATDKPLELGIVYGAGSAEGLASHLAPRKVFDTTSYEWEPVPPFTRRAVLVYDEYRRFEAKAGIQNSALRPMLNELYEKNRYSNATLSNPIEIVDGHLAFLSNTTDETFKTLMNAAESRDSGQLNRLFMVTSASRKRIAKPIAPPESVLAPIRQKLADYIAALPPLNEDGRASHEVVIPLTDEAVRMWTLWYEAIEESDETARLDNLGMRLMGLLAFTSGQSAIDENLLLSVLDILEYERQVRAIYQPIEAFNSLAAMEQRIRATLRRHGRLSKRDLERYSHAHRYGIRLFELALHNLARISREVRLVEDDYELS